MRFSTAILERTRKRVGENFILGMTVNFDPDVDITLSIEALQEIVAHHDERGLIDDNLGVRSIAAMAIGRARLPGHSSTLQRLTADESPFVQTSAIYALVMTGQAVDRWSVRRLPGTGGGRVRGRRARPGRGRSRRARPPATG